MRRVISSVSFLMILVVFQVSPANGQIDFALFTYQGSLKDGSVPANGNYEIRFEFFNLQTGGASLGSNTFTSTPVVNGIFSAEFTGQTNWMSPGANIWVQISVRPTGSSAPLTTLAPRQRITSAPFAISSLLSGDSLRLGGIEANQYLTATTGATTFIQNTTIPQTGSFNLNGTGTANIFDAASAFNIGGNRILSAGGADNIFAGFQAGQANTSGASNSFFGVLTGSANTTGNFNSFFGRSAGNNNSGGNANSFFGASAGLINSSGGNNSFFGSDAGSANSTGSNNTIIGGGANVTLNNLTNATALGYRAAVGQSNSLILGSINGVNGASADTKVGIGTTAPVFKLEIVDSLNTGLRVQTNGSGGTVASFGGKGAFQIDAPGNPGGRFTVLENGNTGIGTGAPQFKLHVVGQDLRVEGNTTSIFPRFSLNFTGGAADAKKWQNYATTNALVFSSINDAENIEARWMQVNRTGNTISGVAFPTGKVAIGGSFTPDMLGVNGTVSIGVLGSAGSTALCQNAQAQISTCSSSIRYKQNVADFRPGLDLVRRLRPVSFNWKADNKADLGLVAEEVGAVEPLLVTRNDKGEVEGVKYDRVGVVLVNAVNEQQAQIERLEKKIDDRLETEITLQKQLTEQAETINRQQEKIDKQQTEMALLKHLVCAQNRTAEICREEK